MKRLIKQKQVTLIEVLIAFALVVMAIIPLISSHVAAIRMQEQQIQRDDLVRIADRIYAEIISKLYQNELDWKEIEGGTVFPIPKEKLFKLHFEGSYRFEEQKSKIHKDHLFGYYLEELKMTFKPIGSNGKEVIFPYLVFMVRDERSIEHFRDQQDLETGSR